MIFVNNYTVFYYVFDEERLVKVVKYGANMKCVMT